MSDKLDLQSPDLVNQNIEKLAALFPNCVTEDPEGKSIDFDLLRQELNHQVVEGTKERYRLEWPGKKEAIVTANLPTTKTLRPVREDSVDFDTTENLYIEGDNLEVLKLLQESYLGKIKMIYIDPPYNTGKDFVYKDNFSKDAQEELLESGQKDEYNQRLVANPETSGRYHSDWLSMMYPRLKLARNLLTEDGYFTISIDDSEYSNLKSLLDQIYGEINYIGTLVFDKNRKNDARYFSIGHEYMIVYARQKSKLDEKGTILREEKEGIDDAKTFFRNLRDKHLDNWHEIEKEWRQYFRKLDKNSEAKKIGRYSKIESERGPFRDDGNISWPGGNGPKYEVIHPLTKKKCKIPDGGWRYSKPEKFWEEVENGNVGFGPDELTLPRQIRYLFEGDGQVMTSVSFSYAQTATMDLFSLMGSKVFENPKNYKDLKRIFKYCNLKDDDIVLDFFSGSATSAHALLDLNSFDNGNRKYIQVQLPELLDEKSDTYKAGYKTICDIGKERIRRAAKKIKEETEADIDYGFRVYRLDKSNMQDVYYRPQDVQQGTLDMFADHIKPDRTADDLLVQVMLDWGLPLSLKIEQKSVAGKKVFQVAGNSLMACFDSGIDEAFAKEIATDKPLRIVFRDASFRSDTAKENVKQLLKQLSPETEMKVI
ncbi:site-specific DNA-methyltransferase [Algoriphagus terrigena]|uniref:site-specific DNA-methyltransferase n=1 Tax=Algoriphagus terrigena TaxID=344884 RepID=UPI0003FCB072|nr:site-specific DNA-methyltransferase [Algoriphagus terrigena]